MGVWAWGFGEGWAHIYAESVAVNHNAIGRGYETYGNATAETVVRRIEPERETFVGKPVTEAVFYTVWRTDYAPIVMLFSLLNLVC